MRIVWILTVLFAVTMAGLAEAGGRRRSLPTNGRPTPVIEYLILTTVEPPLASQPTTDALSEVNAARARRGLRPYIADAGLTQAAKDCCEYRAAHRIKGHVTGGMGDFQFLPQGVTASAVGAGALEPSWGFQACAMYESFRSAGAATVAGSDGLLYHSLFVRR